MPEWTKLWYHHILWATYYTSVCDAKSKSNTYAYIKILRLSFMAII